jgi:hypothetical protein
MRALLAGLAFVAAALTATAAREAHAAPSMEKLALLPVTGTNVHPGYLEAARDIMKDHLLQTGRYNVISVAGESGSVEASVDQALARGRDAGADLAVVIHLARLSGTGRVRLIAYRVSSGALAHADSIGISGGPTTWIRRSSGWRSGWPPASRPGRRRTSRASPRRTPIPT